jgi:hypothetical protein
MIGLALLAIIVRAYNVVLASACDSLHERRHLHG